MASPVHVGGMCATTATTICTATFIVGFCSVLVRQTILFLCFRLMMLMTWLLLLSHFRIAHLAVAAFVRFIIPIFFFVVLVLIVIG